MKARFLEPIHSCYLSEKIMLEYLYKDKATLHINLKASILMKQVKLTILY